MSLITIFKAHERFMNYYGEKHARLNRDQSVFGETKRTWFMSLISPVLFYAPEAYLKNMQSLTVDSLVNTPSWNKLILKLTEEWKEYTLYVRSHCSCSPCPLLDTLKPPGHRVVDFKCLLPCHSIVG